MQKKKTIIVWRPFGEKRAEIAQVLTQICDLDRDYPELVTPGIARRLQDEGYFNLEGAAVGLPDVARIRQAFAVS